MPLSTKPTLQNHTPVDISADDLKSAQKIIVETISQLQFFQHELKQPPVTVSTLSTHLGLLEYAVSDLCNHLHYKDSVLAKEIENRHKEIREANIRIHELTEQLGAGITADALNGALRRFEHILIAWYEAVGWEYGATKFYAHGIEIELSAELSHSESEPHLSDRTDLYNAIQAFQYGLRNMNPDLSTEGKYHTYLLDTDKNRDIVDQLLVLYLPGAHISGFHSIRNGQSLIMRSDLLIPYAALEQLEQRFSPKADVPD